MPIPTDDRNNSPRSDKPLRILWADIDFPSDHLSVKRLRTIYPLQFDDGSSLSSGVSTFFEPSNDKYSSPLAQLNDLINYERTVADYAFYNFIDPYPSPTLDEGCHLETKEAKQKLASLYLEFRLADSPEAARLLIQHLEEQGAQQGKQIKGRVR